MIFRWEVVCTAIIDVDSFAPGLEFANDPLPGHGESAMGATQYSSREQVGMDGHPAILTVQDVLAIMKGLPVDQNLT
jgi:hypothetical protein